MPQQRSFGRAREVALKKIVDRPGFKDQLFVTIMANAQKRLAVMVREEGDGVWVRKVCHPLNDGA